MAYLTLPYDPNLSPDQARFFSSKRARLMAKVIEESRRSGVSPIVIAVQRGLSQLQLQLIEYFYYNGNCTITDKHEAFRIAASTCDLNIIKSFIAIFVAKNHMAQGSTAFHFTARYGDGDSIRWISGIHKEIDISHATSRGSALHDAIIYSNLPAVRALVAEGIDPDAVDKNGNTALHLAAQLGYTEILEFLIKCKRFDVNKRNHQRLTPIMMAIAFNHPKCVGCLVKAPKIDLTTNESFGQYINIYAKNKNACPEIISLLEEPIQERKAFAISFMNAIISNDVEKVRKFLEFKDRVLNDVFDADGNTPLHWAAKLSDATILQILIQSGQFDINKQNSKALAPIFYAISEQNVEAIRCLISVDEKNDFNLIEFARQHKVAPEIITLLEEERHRRLVVKATEFMEAIIRNDATTVRHFIGIAYLFTNISVFVSETERNSPLHLAARLPDTEILQILIQSNLFNITNQNATGQTPTMIAILTNRPNSVRLLLRADHHLTIENYQALLALAQRNQANREIIWLIGNSLRTFGAAARLDAHADAELARASQGIHTASVHATLARTFIKLSDHYPLNDTDITNTLGEIENYLISEGNKTTPQAEDIRLESLPCFRRLLTIPEQEARTSFNFKKVLCLIWKALNDPKSNPDGSDYTKEDIEERRKSLPMTLFQIQNEYAIDDTGAVQRGEDGRPQRYVDVSRDGEVIRRRPKIACVGGSFNHLGLILANRHKDAAVVMINSAIFSNMMRESVKRVYDKKSDKEKIALKAALNIDPSAAGTGIKSLKFLAILPTFSRFAEECRTDLKNNLNELSKRIRMQFEGNANDGVYVEDEKVITAEQAHGYLDNDFIEMALGMYISSIPAATSI